MGGGGDAANSANQLTINGGTLVVDSGGDGLDSNGSATITGGTITVDGPTTDGNGALDTNGTFTISGGVLIAGGSAGMAVAPDASSAQGWLAASVTGQAGSTVQILATDGTEVASFTATKAFASIVYSSPDITGGAAYSVVVDGTTSSVTAGDAPAGGMGGGPGGGGMGGGMGARPGG